MLLSFISRFADKRPTNFDYKIIVGEKLHTFRAGQRWNVGQAIHMAIYARSAQHFQFNADHPALQTCRGVQPFQCHLGLAGELVLLLGMVQAGGELVPVGPAQAELIARNDGFNNAEEFYAYFRHQLQEAPFEKDTRSPYHGRRTLTGQLVHWTTLLY